MSSLLMEALISSTTSLPAAPTMASPILSPAPVLTAGVATPPPEIPIAPDAAAVMVENEDEDSYIYDDDPVHQVMELLNFSVVARKPTNIFGTPLTPGEMMPKSQYLAEKNALNEILEANRRNLLKAQIEMSSEVAKGQELENKMQKVVKVVADVHNLYAQFVKNLVALMKKCKAKSRINGEVRGLVTIGPFPNVEEVDKLLNMLNGLSNQFQNDFENLSNTKQALTEVAKYLGDQAKPSSAVPNQISTTSLAVPNKSSTTNLAVPSAQAASEATVVMEESGGGGGNVMRSVSVGGTSTSSDTPTIVIPEDEFSFGNFGECFNTFSNSTFNADDNNVTNELPTSAEVGSTLAAGSSYALPSLSPATNGEDTNNSIFMPVPNPQRPKLADGRTLYTLVEYPERLNLVNKKHGLDLARGRGGTSWFCTCGQSFSSASLAKYHVRYFSAKWKFMCTLCSRKYPGVNFLKLHMLRTHKIMYVGTNGCRYCAKSFQTTSELLEHLKLAHNKKLPADVEYMTTQPQDIPSTSQTGSIASTSSLPSSSSSSNTTNSSMLSTSSKFQSVLVVNGTRCACGIELGTKDALISHIRSEVEAHGQHFKCTICDEIFNHPCNLKSHFREKHGVDYQDYQQRRYGCSCCDQMFENYEDLERHTVSEHQMDQDHVPLYDPLGDNFNLSTEGMEANENTMTFHVGPNIIGDEMSFTLVEPTVITID